MFWIIPTLIAPALWALNNHIDKHLISKYYSGGQVGSLVLFSALFSIFALPIIAFFQPEVLDISFQSAFWLAISGLINLTAIIFYLYALEDDETSIVTPFWQITPVFAFVLGYVFLNEIVSSIQMIASFIIIISAMILSVELSDTSKITIKKKVFFLMLSSSLCLAISGTLMKFFAIEDGYWKAVFWEMIGSVVGGGILFVLVKKYRDEFVRVFKENKASVIVLDSVNETITIIGNLLFYYAMILAPLGLAFIAESFQPFFVFIYGVVLTLYFPHISTEKLSRRHLTQKLIAIALMFVGGVLLALT
jgi:drug/metabolite transporter (DMT)-like permease